VIKDERISTVPKHAIIFFGLLVCLQLHSASYAAEADSLETGLFEKVLEHYADLETYCDSGTYEDRPGGPYTFERCFRSDGAYKEVVDSSSFWRNREVVWSDGETNHFFSGYFAFGLLKTINYHEEPVRKRTNNANYNVADYILRLLRIDVLSGSEDLIGADLSKFVLNQELSNDEFMVLEHQQTRRNNPITLTDRVWISNRDMIVTKTAEYYNSKQVGYVEISNYQINPGLSAEDLTYELPLLTKYSLYRRPQATLAIVFVIGILYWLKVFSSDKYIKDGSMYWPNKTRMWKYYLKFVVISAIFFVALSTLIYSSGDHPLLTVSIRLYGYLYGLGVVAIGIFLLSAHLAYRIRGLLKTHTPG
jgi:hypothetical protein